ncbi:hypothetical protein J2W24_002383 [Variovorax boronicumulans]|uniref:hypothetical protein n=1 Tax=Variovorax boronicumulans TaxID=436515 RepID=UPI0027889291|nr:hypothetical protein [Variovorax boronicumulans]MDP9916736.1 hypothetical protein [Variovorax boronicumulans]
MSVLIDLDDYLKEVQAFARLADSFVDKTSSMHLSDVVGDLTRHIDAAQPNFTWSTRAPVKFNPSTEYDGPGRTYAPTHFLVSFSCAFTRPAKKVAKGCTVWVVTNSAVHVEIHRAEERAFKMHFDYKNPNQWGPQMHFQVHEEDVLFPVPRIPTGAFLPTDCADLMLSELHTEEWKRHQHKSTSSADVSVLRDGQEFRTLSYLKDIAKKWEDKQFTRFNMLQRYTSSVVALPTSRNRPAKPGW